MTGGYSGAEIDVSQSLTIHFDTPEYVQSLAIAFLYDGPEFGDPKEKAEVVTDVYPSFYLTTISETSASWTGPGTVQYLSPANDAGGGVWVIENPFAGNVSRITLSAVELVEGYGQDSDFSLHSIQTASGESLPLPDGGSTLAFLGLGLMGLGAIRSRGWR